MTSVLVNTTAPHARPSPRFMRRQREHQYYDLGFEAANWWLGKLTTLPRGQMPRAPRELTHSEIQRLADPKSERLFRLVFGYPRALVASEIIWTLEAMANKPNFSFRLKTIGLTQGKYARFLAHVLRSALQIEGASRRQKRAKLVRVFDCDGNYIPSPTYLDRAEWRIALGDAHWRRKGGGLQILNEAPWIFARTKRLTLERDQHRCVWCGNTGHTFEHLIPKSRGGRSVVANGACACEEHNQARGTMGLRRWVRTIGIDWTQHTQLRRLLNPPRHLRLNHPVPLPYLPKV